MNEIFNKDNLTSNEKAEELSNMRGNSSVKFEKFTDKFRELVERDPQICVKTITKEQLIKYKNDMRTGGRRRKIIKELLGLDNNIFEAVRATYLFVYED